MRTIIDTDALVGLYDPNDAHHKESRRLVGELRNRNGEIFLLPTTLTEFAGLFAVTVSFKEAQIASDDIMRSDFVFMNVTKDLAIQAVARFLQQQSRKESLCDCFVMAAAKALGIKHIFSFDKGYKKKRNGFSLISDLL